MVKSRLKRFNYFADTHRNGLLPLYAGDCFIELFAVAAFQPCPVDQIKCETLT